MGIWKSLAGTYTIEVTSASSTSTLTAINTYGINLFNVVFVDDLRIRGSIYKFDYAKVTECLSKRGEKWDIIERRGLYWTIRNLNKRPILLTGCLIFLFMVFFLPTRVLFVDVHGNDYIPKEQIIAEAEKCGIKFGASRRDVRSEKMKNALLSSIPQLQWAGINTIGCTAVISVHERSEVQKEKPPCNVSSIVALRDGVIEDMTVIRGNALCRAGQAVKQGQVLVSGYTDCGIYIKAEPAEAEINAKTLRLLNVVSPGYHAQRGVVTKIKKRYAIRIGKNIINFCKDSGISDGKYVKMYSEEILTLPGGFKLPFAFVTEQLVCYDHIWESADQSEDISWLTEKADAYLRDQMVAGRILDSNVSVELSDDVYRLSGYYSCLEMIGRVRSEEIVENNG